MLSYVSTSTSLLITLAKAIGRYVSLEDILPALSLLTGTDTTDNIDSRRTPCEMKLVKHIASKGTINTKDTSTRYI